MGFGPTKKVGNLQQTVEGVITGHDLFIERGYASLSAGQFLIGIGGKGVLGTSRLLLARNATLRQLVEPIAVSGERFFDAGNFQGDRR